MSAIDLRVPTFEPDLQIAPTELFRRLTDREELALYDLRENPAVTLCGARFYESGEDLPPGAILIDEYGQEATERARAEARGIRALYGGIELYRFALNPAVVGEERFLIGDG